MSHSATIGGITDIKYFSYLHTHGIEPSVAFVVTPVDLVTPANVGVGDITISDGTTSLTLQDCIPDLAVASFTQSGNFMEIPFLDRRWAWQFGSVSGWYNRKDSEGNLIPSQKKSAQELATILADAMGETGYNVSALPSNTYPEVRWDREVPAYALSELCQLSGCRITLNLATNALHIFANGVGVALPSNSYLMTPSVNLSLIKKPSKVVASSAPVLFEHRFELEAVGLDTDGELKPIDDLSYKPNGEPFAYDMWNVDDEEALELALESVYRYWRIANNERNRSVLQGVVGTLADINQIEFYDHLTTTDENDYYLAPIVFGDFYLEEGFESENVWNKWEYGWTFDTDSKLIKLSDPAYKLDGDTEETPSMYLQTSFMLRANETQAIFRSAVSRNVPNNPWADTSAGTFAVVKEDIKPYLRYTWPSEFGEQDPTGVETNNQDVVTELGRFADKEVDRYLSSSIGGQGIYAGLQSATIDGLRDYLKYEFGDSIPFTTTLTINSKPNPHVLSPEQKQLRERQKQINRLEQRRANRRKFGKKIYD